MDNHLFLLLIIILGLTAIIIHIYWKNKVKGYLKSKKEEDARIIHLEKMASLGVLSAGIAHEINNPLMFLIINLNFIGKFTEDENINKSRLKDIKVIVEECLNGTNRIKKIVQDLLTFSKQSGGERVLTDIKQLLDATIRILWNEIKNKVEVVRDYRLKSEVWIDSSQIGQVFLNIILNGAKAIKDKGIITILTDEDEENVFIKISDTGCGIPKDKKLKIFEPFYTTKGGTGLGLYITQTIMKNVGGRIEVDSEVGKGSVFTILLPKKDIENGYTQ